MRGNVLSGGNANDENYATEIVSGGKDSMLRVWNVEERREVKRMVHSSWVDCVAVVGRYRLSRVTSPETVPVMIVAPRVCVFKYKYQECKNNVIVNKRS